MFATRGNYYTEDTRTYPIRRSEQKIDRVEPRLVDNRPEWQKLRDRRGHSRVQNKRK